MSCAANKARSMLRCVVFVCAVFLLAVVAMLMASYALPAQAHADSVVSYKVGKVTAKKQGVAYAKARAVYKSGKHETVAFVVKAKKSLKSIPVQDTVHIKGKVYTVVGIKAGAFKTCKAKRLKLYTKHLAKKGIKGSLTGSKVSSLYIMRGVPAKKRNAYMLWFWNDKTCGKRIYHGAYYTKNGKTSWRTMSVSPEHSSSGSSGSSRVELSTDYGVFIGYTPASESTSDKGLKAMAAYDKVMIDAQSYTAEQVKWLKKKGCRVYSYLNVGSIETSRDYYNDYSDITLGNYENWPDEKWVDVSQEKWQTFITGTLAKELLSKGVDGFFVDNLDVYYQYQTSEKAEAIYQGLCTIMEALAKMGMPAIANGGDVFVSKYIEDKGTAVGILFGVNQECVFSSIEDYDAGTFGKNDSETRAYYESYLAACSDGGLDVHVLEYTTDKKLIKKIKAYCDSKGYKYFVASSLGLSV